MGVQLGKPRLYPMPQTESKNVQTIKSQQVIDSDVSISNSELPQKCWKAKETDLRSSKAYSKGHRTTESWMKVNTSSVPQFHQPSSRYEQPAHKSRNCENEEERKSYRYYSADKLTHSTRRNTKPKKNSDVVQYTQI
jgi:hypothetical protein